MGALLLVARYGDLPDTIPAYRTLTGAPSLSLAKSWPSVLRIPAMGIGQLGMVTVMARQTDRAQQPVWGRFWVAAALAASAKTLVENIQYALLDVGAVLALQLAFMVAAFLPVAVFLAVALRLWTMGGLGRIPIPFATWLLVGGFAAIWFVSAALPLFY